MEMVDSVNDFLNDRAHFRVILISESALNKIIQNSRIKKKVSLQGTERPERGPVSARETNRLHDPRHFRVTGAHGAVLDYADSFSVTLRNDDVQEFATRWDGILLSMTKIPSDDILEGLYKLRIRESEKLKTVLELYNMDIHQKKAGPDDHRLKTTAKRSIEQNLRMRNFEARNGNYERNAVVINQGTKQREQRTLGDCWQWKANGQCSQGDNCSFRHDTNKRAKTTQPNPSPRSSTRQNERNASRTRSPRGRVPVEECFDCPARITSKEIAPIHSVKNGILQNACSTSRRMDADLGTSALMRIARLKNSPAKRSEKNGDKSAVAMLKKNERHQRTGRPVLDADSSNTLQLGCVFQDMEPPKFSSILRKSSDMRKPIRCVRFTKAVVRHADIRDQNPSLGIICLGEPHQRSPNAPNFFWIGLRRRQNGKSDVPVKQRGGWPKIS